MRRTMELVTGTMADGREVRVGLSERDGWFHYHLFSACGARVSSLTEWSDKRRAMAAAIGRAALERTALPWSDAVVSGGRIRSFSRAA